MIFQTRSGERRERNLKTLKEVHVGETVKVQKLTGEGPVKRRKVSLRGLSQPTVFELLKA